MPTIINKREFVRHISKYLKDTGDFIVDGKKSYLVKIKKIEELVDERTEETSDSSFPYFGGEK